MLLVYTDESHGYGNTGSSNQPAQSPVDANPVQGDITPELGDAAFRAAGVSQYSDFGAGWTDNYDDGSGSWVHAFDCLSFDVTTLAGDTVSASNQIGDLKGNVIFDMGDGCGTFAYGFNDLVNDAPTAVIQVKKTTINPDEELRFDGSGSHDDFTAPSNLTYEWDFEDDGTFDAIGPIVDHSYSTGGNKTVRLRVTDDGSSPNGSRTTLVGESTITIIVNATPTAVSVVASSSATSHAYLIGLLLTSAVLASAIVWRRRFF